MSEYWLISAPGDKTCQQTWETMNNVTSKQNNLSVNYKFHIPDLKVRPLIVAFRLHSDPFYVSMMQVGTLDQLVGLSDDLGKLDGYVDAVTKKVASYLGEVLEDQRDKLNENLLANNSKKKFRFLLIPGSPLSFLQVTWPATSLVSNGTWPNIPSNSHWGILQTLSASKLARLTPTWRANPVLTTTWRATCITWRRSKRKANLRSVQRPCVYYFIVRLNYYSWGYFCMLNI